jgi:hypothetical protein
MRLSQLQENTQPENDIADLIDNALSTQLSSHTRSQLETSTQSSESEKESSNGFISMLKT